jgi:perosamine synthetase
MKPESVSVYKKSVIENFNFLKSSETIQQAYLRAIPIGTSGFLLPVSYCHLNDKTLVKNICEWRNTNVNAFPTQFVASEESTLAWMQHRLLNIPDRILFLVVNNSGQAIGHIGLNGCINDEMLFKVDYVVRGLSGEEPGIFSSAIRCMIERFRKTLNVKSFYLCVMDDNQHAVNFYIANGFVEEYRIPLLKEVGDNRINYREARPGEVKSKDFIRMSYSMVKPVGQEMILTAGPSISAREVVYSYDAAQNGWGREWSKYLNQFECAFSKYVGAKYALATSSCTGGLQIALMALGVGSGDEVIVPDQTWVATANAVRYVGAIPIFADVEIDTWNIDADSIESLITKKTKAIIAVHMYGHPARMDKILALARRHQLRVIEDAAPAIGAAWNGQPCGSFGDFAAFSFQGAKLLVTGEGGMLVTSNHELYVKAKKIWDQGRNPARAFWIDSDGVKFKMSNIQAALGLAQLERADELIEMKRRIFCWYEEGLKGVPYVRLNKEVEGARSIYWMTSLYLDKLAPINRDALIAGLRLKNIDTRPVFPAISQYPIWPLKQEPKPNAKMIGEQALNLPSGVCLSKDEVNYVCKTITELLGT